MSLRHESGAGEPPGTHDPSASPPLEEVVRAVQAEGADHPAAEVLFRHLDRSFLRFFRAAGFSPDRAEDLTQDALLRVFRKIDDYRFQGSFWAWARSIAVTTLKNHWRDLGAQKRAGREVPLELPPAGEEEKPPRERPELTVDAEAERRTIEGERRRLLRTAFDELPTRMRQTAQLYFGEGFSYQETADALGVGLNSVRSQLGEARQRLRRILGQHLAAPPGDGGSLGGSRGD